MTWPGSGNERASERGGEASACRMSLFYCIPPPYPLAALLPFARPAKFQVLWREFELAPGRRDNSSNLPPYNYFLHAAAATRPPFHSW